MGSKPSKTIDGQHLNHYKIKKDDRSLKRFNIYLKALRPNRKNKISKISSMPVTHIKSTINKKEYQTTDLFNLPILEIKDSGDSIQHHTSDNLPLNHDKQISRHRSCDLTQSNRVLKLPLINSNQHDPLIIKSNKKTLWNTFSEESIPQIDKFFHTDITDLLLNETTATYQNPFFFLSNLDSEITVKDIIQLLNKNPDRLHLISKEAFQKNLLINSPSSASCFFKTTRQLLEKHKLDVAQKNILTTYLAQCHLFGFGTHRDLRHGLNILKSNPSCETYYMLGQLYLDGLMIDNNIVLEKDEKVAFEYLKTVTTYDPVDDSTLYTISEAQRLLARMLFKGEGIDRNCNQSLIYLFQSAENNNSFAQFLIGLRYENGLELEKDLEKAKLYYEKSAKNGFSNAQAALGCILVSESNRAEGIKWLKKAIEAGNSRAELQLGLLYHKTADSPHDRDRALYYYESSAKKNNPRAQYVLGTVYYFGHLGIQKNLDQAIEWIEKSAKGGCPPAQRMLGYLYQHNKIPSHDPDAKNNRAAVRWFKRAAVSGDVLALGILGYCYELGKGLELNLEKSLACYTKASKIEGPYACHASLDQARLLQKLSRHFEAFMAYKRSLSLSLPEKDEECIRQAKTSIARYHLWPNKVGIDYNPKLGYDTLMTLATESNDSLVHYWLGSIYTEGIPDVVQIDNEKAFHHYFISAESGDNDSVFMVAFMMANNMIPGKNSSDAFPWYKKAAENGHPKSMYSTGLCYYKGIGQDKPNLDLALKWFQTAAQHNVQEAVPYIARTQFKLMAINSTSSHEGFSDAILSLKVAAEENDNPCAQRELGKLYMVDKSSTADHRKAFGLFQKASAKQDPEANAFLGRCYMKGLGVKRDIKAAIKYYKEAAKLGYPFAYSGLAELYYEEKDLGSAYDYYLLASKLKSIETNTAGKTAKMMIARLTLGDLPLLQNNPSLHPALIKSRQLTDPNLAFNTLLTLAVQDNFRLAFQSLGSCYLYGTGTEFNPDQAIYWLTRASQEQNDSQAYFHLAQAYGVLIEPQDPTLALNQLIKSAELGCTEAKYQLGIVYLHGKFGTLPNTRTAAIWFRQAMSESHALSASILSQLANSIDQKPLELEYQKEAARLGHVPSMRLLGQAFLEQLALPSLSRPMQECYLEEALWYFQMASDACDLESIVVLGKIYGNLTRTHLLFPNHPSSLCGSSVTCIGQNESRIQAEDEERALAIEFYLKASEMGHTESTFCAAELFHHQKMYPKALALFALAARQGHVLARFYCALYSVQRLGDSQLDPETGFQELLHCANMLHCEAAYKPLAECYENGLGVTKDDQLASEWYEKAAESTNDSDAYYRLGLMYATDRILKDGLNKDMEAYRYFELATNLTSTQHGLSCYHLGLYCLNGIKKNQDYLKVPDIKSSIRYFRIASSFNIPEAMLQLGLLLLSDITTIERLEEGLSELKCAADMGLSEAQFQLGFLYHHGEIADSRSDRDYLTMTQCFTTAYDLFSKSAEQKHPRANYYLALYHHHGIVVDSNLNLASKHYDAAVEWFKGYEDAPERWLAEFGLARILHRKTENRARAYELFQVAHLHAPSEFKILPKIMISRYHLYGWGGVAAQEKEALDALVELAKCERFGYCAYLDIAQSFEQGKGIEQNKVQAFQWYGEIINLKNDTSRSHSFMFLNEDIKHDKEIAMLRLSEFYRDGVVVKPDAEKADRLYRLAIEKISQSTQDY